MLEKKSIQESVGLEEVIESFMGSNIIQTRFLVIYQFY
jgi:hypothetical protein